jgi:RNA polymerase sigma-70 factor (ECF subfamily)
VVERDSDWELISQLVTSQDQRGVEELMARHRARLRRMVAARLDPRLAARIDPSDVVQETLMEAARRLPDYLRDQPLPFYPWLRKLAAQRMANLAERHIGARRRSVTREEQWPLGLSDASVAQLANRLVATGSSPSGQLIRQELRDQVRSALERLPYLDREVLVLQFVEQLSPKETAAAIGISPEAVGMRRLRALRRLSAELGEDAP